MDSKGIIGTAIGLGVLGLSIGILNKSLGTYNKKQIWGWNKNGKR